MAKANAFNRDLTNCTGLPLSTGVSGDIPITSLSSGTNASASTYYSKADGWVVPPSINAGAQNCLAYYAASGNALSPLANIPNSVLINGTTPAWSPMTDGQIVIGSQTGTRYSVGNITRTNGVIVENDSNSITISYVYPLNNITGTSATMIV